jgi:hypothetical protein
MRVLIKIKYMKRLIAIIITVELVLTFSAGIFAQSDAVAPELGIDVGTFTNFPLNQDYLSRNITTFYLAPYVRTGQHEFSAGFVYPTQSYALFGSENKLDPCMGAVASYKYYIFNAAGRENLYVHYGFQYLRLKGSYDTYFTGSTEPVHWDETDMYINNVVGFGYNLFFDTDARFGLFYSLDYVIAQTSYNTGSQNSGSKTWTTQFVWNNMSTNLGLLFKLTSFKKKSP